MTEDFMSVAETTEVANAADRLETLLARRQREVATGAWPPPVGAEASS